MATLADKGAVVGCAPLIKRGALLLGPVARRAVAAVGGIRSAALLMALRARVALASAAVGAAVLSFGFSGRLARSFAGHRRASLVIVKRLARVGSSAARKGAGPGESAGEVAGVLPAGWMAFPLPGEFIGKKVAALALARGEPWALAGQQLTIGGRVLIDTAGVPVFVATASAAQKVVDAAMLEAVQINGGLSMPSGSARDAWLSARRTEAAAYLKKNAKSFNNVQGAAKRAALVADLRFMELRA